MEHVMRTEVDNIDEVAKVVNKLIDEINLLKTSNDVYNAEVEEYNQGTAFKKGGK